MSTLDSRKKSYENKFSREAKLDFAVEARLSKLYGLWAAEKLGIDAESAGAYASEVVAVNLEEPGFDDILRKVRADFDKKGLDISDHVMNEELDKCLIEAKKQINS